MAYENLRYGVEGPLALVTLNRPQRLNAVSLAMLEELHDSLERAVALQPSHLEANLNLAMLLEDLELCEAALPHYKAALAAAPLVADVHVSLALLYEKLDLPRRGRAHWRRYLQLEPRGAWAEVARSRLDP